MRDRTKSKLSSPIIYPGSTIDEMLSAGIHHFYNIFLKKEVKPTFRGKRIFFDMDKNHKHRFLMPFPLSFMHITSLDAEDKYSVSPCINDISTELCKSQCLLTQAHPAYMTYGRWECLYRLHRIHWIGEVIVLANAGDENIYIFEEDKTDGNKKFTDVNIRYHCGMDDYLIILRYRLKEDDYLFITAFPVVSKRKKEQLDKKCKK